MDVLLAGGTGFVGTYLSRELSKRGHDVTALSRSPNGAPDGVETAIGDVTAYDSIESVVEGRDVVVNLVSLSPLFRPSGGEQMHDTIHRGGTKNLLRAAEAGDVDRFVQVSALGADPEGPTHFIRAKGRAERLVRSSDLDWVIFRPSVVFGDGGEFVSFTKKLAPPYVTPLPGGGETRFQPIYVEDVASMIADGVEDDGHVGEQYEIGGPEVLTLAQVAELAHRADGRSVTIVPIPMRLAGIGLSIADVIPGFPMGSDQYRGLQFDNTTTDNGVAAFGYTESDLTTLGAYLGLDGT